MASIKSIISKYRSTTTPEGMGSISVAPAETGAAGPVQRNMAAEVAAARTANLVKRGATELSEEQVLIDEQRKQAGMQRDNQILELQRQGTEEKQRYKLMTKRSLDSLENSRENLTTAEKLDNMEASASFLRLQDDKYRYQLADIGRRNRLTEATAFDMELKKAIFSEELSILKDNIAFRSMLDMKEADFQKALADIDIESAIDLAKKESRDAADTAMISAAGSSVSTAAQIGMSRYDKEPKEPEE